MKKKIIKSLMCLAIVFSIVLPGVFFLFDTGAVKAIDEDTLWGSKKDEIRDEAGYETAKDPREIVASVIRIILGFLGLVAVIIIILGGFKWMTSGGSDDKAGEARKLIVNGVIGLLIIVAAYALAEFVINQLVEVTS